MIYYFLPGTGIYGGIKMGYQFVDALNTIGIPACIASPEGLAAQWFSSEAPVVDQGLVLENWKSDDWAVFSLPSDYEILRPVCEQLVYHCQGTDPAIDTCLVDESLQIVTCWAQATEYVAERNRDSFVVPLAIPDVFYYSGESKVQQSLGFMPRRGQEFVADVITDLHGWTTHAIDGVNEVAVANTMKASTHFLASSPGEWFGLPVLEAMASGCVVLSPGLLGGAEFLIHRKTGIVGDAPLLREFLTDGRLSGEDEHLIAQRAIAMAHSYSLPKQRSALRQAVEEGLFSG